MLRRELSIFAGTLLLAGTQPATAQRLFAGDPAATFTAEQAARGTRAHAILFQRPPTAKELAIATRFLTGRETDKKAWSEYAQALLASNETQFVD